MTIRRKPTGMPLWEVNQIKRENELHRKYPKIFRKISDKFWEARNYNPNTSPEECLEIALKGVNIRQKTRQDFEEVFVKDFEKGLVDWNKYS